MNPLRRLLRYFTRGELLLWGSSVLLISLAFFAFDGGSQLTLVASLIGATALILCAKGNPAGQALIVVFSLLYGVISYGFAYYGEMITYLGMTAPMAMLALVSWLRNPYQGRRSEVRVNRVTGRETAFMLLLSAVVTGVFFLILRAFGTANLLPSTLSVTTSFLAVYLTFRRSPYYALAYAANDLVLIVLWVLASMTSTSYLSVAMCFVMFFVNDLYGLASWLRMERRQRDAES